MRKSAVAFLALCVALAGSSSCSAPDRGGALPAGSVGSGGLPAGGSPGSAGTIAGTGGTPLVGGQGGGHAGSAGTAGAAAGNGGLAGFGGAPPTALVPECARKDPFLAANGTQVRNDRGQGDAIVFKGANLGGWLMTEPWMSPVGDILDDFTVNQTLIDRFGASTADALLANYRSAWMQDADFANAAALGFNALRVPFAVYHMQNEDGSIRPDAFEELDYAVSKAWEHCIYSIIDLHGAWGGASTGTAGGKVGPAELFTNQNYQDLTVVLWQAIASHFKDNPAVAGYDLINEPVGGAGVTNQQRWDLQDRIYDAVRAVDPDHMIFIEAIWWLDDLPPPSQYGWSNVTYQCHHYEGFGDKEWMRTDEQAQKDGADAKVTDYQNHAAFAVPFFLGEFTFWEPAGAWNYGIQTWDQAGISWTVWSFRANVDGSALNNGWGVYNPIDPRPVDPDLFNDSETEIGNKWQAHGAATFGLNPMLKTALAMPAVERDSYQASAGQPLNVAAPGVLANDTHVNMGQPGVVLSVALVTPPDHGSVVLNADGSFSYTPEAGFSGTDVFSYSVFDGRLHAGSPGTAVISVQ